MKPVQVEFYQSPFGECTWQVRTSSDEIVASELLPKVRHAVTSFKRFCNLVDARAPIEIVGNAKEEAHKLLTK